MSAFGAKLRRLEGGRVAFWCPGCGEAHQVTVGAGLARPRWDFNGDGDRPTFSPSILVRGTRDDLSDEEWVALLGRTAGEREAMVADRRTSFVCHSYVREGRIQFLGDCTHALAGQTVELPDFPA